MPDRENTIAALYDCLDDDAVSVLVPWDVVHDALALLKAQEPVEPIWYQEGRWFKTWRCGACGDILLFRNGKDKPKYCIECGRAVKWGD